MSFDYKYLPHGTRASSKANEKAMQQLDTLLDALRTARGEYHARTVEFLVQTRLLTATLPEPISLANARFVSGYVTQVVKEKYGDNFDVFMQEFIADAERISIEIATVLMTGESK